MKRLDEEAQKKVKPWGLYKYYKITGYISWKYEVLCRNVDEWGKYPFDSKKYT